MGEAKRRKKLNLPPRRTYLGSWTLPSGNACDVYLGPDAPHLTCEWDVPPSPAWPRSDVDYYEAVTFPEIIRAMATQTGQRAMGVLLGPGPKEA